MALVRTRGQTLGPDSDTKLSTMERFVLLYVCALAPFCDGLTNGDGMFFSFISSKNRYRLDQVANVLADL